MWDSYIKNTQKTYALSSTPAPIRANNSPFLPPMGRVQICAAYHRKHKGLSGRTASMASNEFVEFVHDCQSSDLCGKSK